MKLRLLFLCLIFSSGLTAQEYWDREDFEIGNRGVENTWREFAFTWQTSSNFSLPDGTFLNISKQQKNQQIDMLAVINKTNRNKTVRNVDLGSPLPKREKENKIFEITAKAEPRDYSDPFFNPYFSNPILSPYNRFGNRRFIPYRYNY